MSKIAIISDSHDNPVRIDQMLEKIKKEKIKTIIHCGDVCSFRVLNYLCNNFPGKIYLSIGNVDADHEINQKRNKIPNLKIFPKFGELKIDNLNIAFVHFPKKAKELASTEKYNFVFYGHTHKPWEEDMDNCKIRENSSDSSSTRECKSKLSHSSRSTSLINPGTLAGLFTRSTFAILDTKTKDIELVIL